MMDALDKPANIAQRVKLRLALVGRTAIDLVDGDEEIVSRFYRWVNGGQSPTLRTLRRIALVLGIDEGLLIINRCPGCGKGWQELMGEAPAPEARTKEELSVAEDEAAA